MRDAGYADDLVLHENIPAQAESLLYGLQQTAGGISLCVKANQS